MHGDLSRMNYYKIGDVYYEAIVRVIERSDWRLYQVINMKGIRTEGQRWSEARVAK